MGLIKLAAASAAGYALYKYATRHAETQPAAFAPGEPHAFGAVNVRNSGPDSMRSNPPEWDEVDEASDESFPASDPAAKY